MDKTNIASCQYTGPVDAAGLPHGKGTMLYIADKTEDSDARDFKYEGEFVHGIRHGQGYICRMSYVPNSKTAYEWYSEGDYDAAGRLIAPTHSPGSYEPYHFSWVIFWQGTWENDIPTIPKLNYSDHYPTVTDLQAAAETAYEVIKDKIRHAGNTAIRLCHEPVNRNLTGLSKFGGKPDLPQGVEYPMIEYTDDDGKVYEDPMFFVCQLRCEELASHDPQNLLPHSGMIYVFAEIDYFLGHLNSEYGGLGKWDKRFFRVMYYDARWCIRLDTHTVLCSDGVTPYGLPKERITFEEGADPNSDGIRLLGMPYIDDVREAMPEYINLLQIDEVDRWHLTFHDCGTLNFLIRREDLQNRDFNKVECYLHSF